MKRSIVIIGTSGNALDILDVIEAINNRVPTWVVAGLLDDARPPGSEYLGVPVLGRVRDAGRFPEHVFINAIGSDRSFRHRPEILAATGLRADRFVTLVHPSASVSSRATLGRGTCVNFGVSVGGGAVIGDHVTLGPGCIIGHDAQIEDFTVVAAGAVISGVVRLGQSCYIGARAVIRQQLQIGERSLVGMGAVVIRGVAAGMTVVGNPARPLPTQEPTRYGEHQR